MKKLILLSILLILAVRLMATSSSTITVSGRIMNPVKNISILYEPVANSLVSIHVKVTDCSSDMYSTNTNHDGYYSQVVTIVDSLFNDEVLITVTSLTHFFQKTVEWTGGDIVINLP